LEDLGQDRAAAMERCSGSAAAAKLRYDILVRRDPLEVGDWVLLRRGQKLKFMSKWIGPFRIHRVGPGGTYQLVTPDGAVKEDLVHRDRLKRCLVNEESIPNGLWSDETLESLDEVFDGAGAGYGQEGYDIAPVDARHVTSGPDNGEVNQGRSSGSSETEGGVSAQEGNRVA
jgi:hypothetical protein